MSAPRNVTTVSLRITPRVILRWHLACIVLLVVCHWIALAVLSQIDAVEHPGWAAVAGKFLLDSELNLPTWFQTICLWTCSVILAWIALTRWNIRSVDTASWSILSLLFVGLSFEEMAGFHELLILPLRNRLDLHSVFYFGWVIPGIVFSLVVGSLFVRFWWRLPPVTRTRFAWAAGMYLGGALGLEMVGGIFAEQASFQGQLAEQAGSGLPYLICASLEETLEMSGIALFLFSLLSWWEPGRVILNFQTGRDPGMDEQTPIESTPTSV